MSELERLYTPPQIGAPGRLAARERSRRLRRTGALVVLMAALLLAAIAALQYRSLGVNEVLTYLPYSDGLTPGAVVEQAGYPIGKVSAIEPLFDSSQYPADACPQRHNAPCFRVEMRVRSDWPLAVDSVAQIGSKLLQGAIVSIRPGNSIELAGDGSVLQGAGQETDLAASADALVVKLTELLDHVRDIMDQTIAPMLASIQSQVGALQTLVVNDGGTGTDAATGQSSGDVASAGSPMGAALSDVAEVLANLKQLTGDLAAQADEQRDTDVGRLVRATRNTAENVEAITAGIEQRSADIRRAIAEFTELGAELNDLVDAADPKIQSSLTDTQYLIQETATALTPILNTVDQTTRNLLELSRDLRDNPGVLLGGRNTRDNAPDNYR